jgi:hypothetical protein
VAFGAAVGTVLSHCESEQTRFAEAKAISSAVFINASTEVYDAMAAAAGGDPTSIRQRALDPRHLASTE